MDIIFEINENTINNMSWEEVETFERIQEGTAKLYQIRPVVARFMVDESGKTIPHKKAFELLGKVPAGKIREIFESFSSSLKLSTVPKEIGSPSSLPSEARKVDSAFQPG